mmetsp:Transcript_119673/g.381943  ORF Transcript_119673/g.381943 Transcript_119673/m.381943 type:complete len:224 (+) Transcript_119673:511-1182(+)
MLHVMGVRLRGHCVHHGLDCRLHNAEPDGGGVQVVLGSFGTALPFQRHPALVRALPIQVQLPADLGDGMLASRDLLRENLVARLGLRIVRIDIQRQGYQAVRQGLHVRAVLLPAELLVHGAQGLVDGVGDTELERLHVRGLGSCISEGLDGLELRGNRGDVCEHGLPHAVEAVREGRVFLFRALEVLHGLRGSSPVRRRCHFAICANLRRNNGDLGGKVGSCR